MVEVFKTNVVDATRAEMLVEKIHHNFTYYKANFDLDDCDNILRIKSFTGQVQSSPLIHFLQEHGVDAEILPD
jgi:hypothetical protein